MKNNGRIGRLKKKENRLVSKGSKAVDEGRDKKADRILGRAAKTENKRINLQEKKLGKAEKGKPIPPKKTTPKADSLRISKSIAPNITKPETPSDSLFWDKVKNTPKKPRATFKRKGGLVKKKK